MNKMRYTIPLIEEYENVFNVKSFGAVGDGVTDDTVMIQAAIDAAAAAIGTIYIPDGTYMINPSRGIDILSNITVIFASNALFKNLPHNLEGYEILRIHDKENITIYNPQVDGVRTANSSTTGEWGMGISINGSKNIKIYNPVCKNCWGDGIYIGETSTLSYSENIRIFDALCDNNRRQGISIISGKQIYLVRPKLINTNGTPPQAGLDIESNYTTNYLNDIRVIDPYTEGNVGGGIKLSPGALQDTGKTIEIYITNHISINDFNAMALNAVQGSLPGIIKLVNPQWINTTRGAAFTAVNFGINGPRVEIINPTVINPNRINSDSDLYDSAFTIYNTPTSSGSIPMGNIHIYEPEIIVTTGLPPTRSLFIQEYRAGIDLPQNISFINPKHMLYQSNKTPLCLNATNFILLDDYNALVDESDHSIEITVYNYRRTYTSRNYTNNNVITLAKLPRGFEITFESWGTYYLRIIPEATDIILPLNVTGGKYVRSNQKGARITIRKVDTDTWFVTEMIGTWEVEA